MNYILLYISQYTVWIDCAWCSIIVCSLRYLHCDYVISSHFIRLILTLTSASMTDFLFCPVVIVMFIGRSSSAVGLSVGNDRELWKNGWLDWDAVWDSGSGVTIERCIKYMMVKIYPNGSRQIFVRNGTAQCDIHGVYVRLRRPGLFPNLHWDFSLYIIAMCIRVFSVYLYV